MSLEVKLDYIEFRQELLFYNSELDKMLFEYNLHALNTHK